MLTENKDKEDYKFTLYPRIGIDFESTYKDLGVSILFIIRQLSLDMNTMVVYYWQLIVEVLQVLMLQIEVMINCIL